MHTSLTRRVPSIDSAQMYGNEADAGRSILAFLQRSPGLQRADIHFTTKLASNASYARARRSISESVRACGLGHIDLFLLHSPYGGRSARLESWRAVEDAIEAGEVRTGGVSNYGVKHVSLGPETEQPTALSLESTVLDDPIRIADYSLPCTQLQELLSSSPRVRPAVNQIELHPFNQQRALVAFCRASGIVLEAYAPLVRALRFADPTVVRLAARYACSPPQLLLRWSLQHGLVPLPKSTRRARIVENADVQAFAISGPDMACLDGLDEGLVTDWDPTDAD